MTRPGGHKPAYRAAPGVRWVVEGQGVVVIDELARRSEELSYPEAAVWELLLSGHTVPETISMVKHIAGFTDGSARTCVTQCIDLWCKAGWLVN